MEKLIEKMIDFSTEEEKKKYEKRVKQNFTKENDEQQYQNLLKDGLNNFLLFIIYFF